MHSATKVSAVWQAAVRKLCRQISVPNALFPLDRMSLLELEYLATAHSRLVKGLWSEINDSYPLAPISTRIISLSRRNLSSYPLGHFKNFALVPGGRFIVTLTGAGLSSVDLIQLWDIGYCAGAIVSDRPVASLETTSHFTKMYAAPTHDATGVVIAISQPSDSPDMLCVCSTLVQMDSKLCLFQFSFFNLSDMALCTCPCIRTHSFRRL